ncbi:hypothetical protein [Haladaptatus halobius]|uniref:hypothetical protein n=1 Tax=Haladaptatus halobius TaxID=2884875 RepID=UPI0034A0EA76
MRDEESLELVARRFDEQPVLKGDTVRVAFSRKSSVTLQQAETAIRIVVDNRL